MRDIAKMETFVCKKKSLKLFSGVSCFKVMRKEDCQASRSENGYAMLMQRYLSFFII